MGVLPTVSPSMKGKYEDNAEILVLKDEYLWFDVLNICIRYSVITSSARRGSIFL